MRILMFGAALLILAGSGVAIRMLPAGSTAGPSVAQLGWMAGCLELRSDHRIVEEQRMSVRGASMLGMARTTSDKGLVEYELTLIHQQAGKILFQAWPSGQPTAVFTATSAGPDSAVFAVNTAVGWPLGQAWKRIFPACWWMRERV